MRNLITPTRRVIVMSLLAALGLVASDAWAQQAPPFEEIKTLASSATPVESAPFNIAVAGEYDVTLTDLGAQLSPAAPVASIQLAVMRGPTVVTTLTVASTRRVALSVGTYVLRVAGVPGAQARSGLFSALVQGVGATTPAGTLTATLSAAGAPVSNAIRLFGDDVTLPAGTYTVELLDLAFPQALAFSSVIVTTGATPVALLNRPGTPGDIPSFTAAAGASYSIYAVGDSGTIGSGLFAIRIRNASNTVVYTQSLPIGRVTLLGETPSLSAGSYTLVTTDPGFPAALGQSGALVTARAQQVVRSSTTGNLPFTVTAAGVHEVFALAVPTSASSSGAFGVEIRSGAAVPFAAVGVATGTAATATPVYSYPVDITASGTHVAALTDLQFPSTFATAAMAVVQGGGVLSRINTAGSLNAALIPGRAFVLVAAQPSTSGLFHASLGSSGNQLWQTTQGVGNTFSSRSFVVATTGDYRFTLNDVGFPAQFAELAAILTRGSERLGQIFGGGSLDLLQATPGTYQISFITRTDATLKAGTYYLAATLKPPNPVITLSSTPASPTVGGAVDLNWTVLNATSCVASGGWTGARTTSGTERIAAVSAATTFTLACTGSGGSTTQSLTVTPAPPSGGGGGGGATDQVLIMLLLLLTGWSVKRRAGVRALA
jgi:hypothetical protein